MNTICFSQPISNSYKKTQTRFAFNHSKIIFDASIEGGFLSKVSEIEKNKFELISAAEDYPIDKSPTYAFKLITKEAGKLILDIHFLGAMAPLTPKISHDGVNWETIPCQTEGSDLLISISAKANDTVYIARHPLFCSTQMNRWINKIAVDTRVHVKTCGQTVAKRDLKVLDIYQGDAIGKDIIVFMARQHPTEVPGQMAFNTFIETLLANKEYANTFFKNYRIVAFPMMNPDGVDNGHWRNNFKGADLNRHWTDTTSQPETHAAIAYMRNCMKEGKIRFAIDFHAQDGGKSSYLISGDSTMTRGYIRTAQKYKQSIDYNLITSYKSFSTIKSPNYSDTWLSKNGVPTITHETWHDAKYPDVISTAKIGADALVEFMLAQPLSK
jgi:hypothetical protein